MMAEPPPESTTRPTEAAQRAPNPLATPLAGREDADDPTRLLNASATTPVILAIPEPGAEQQPTSDDETADEFAPLARALADDAVAWRTTLPSDALLAQLARLLPTSMENTAPKLTLPPTVGVPAPRPRTPVSLRKPLRRVDAGPDRSGALAMGQRAFLGALSATVVVILLATLFTALAARAGHAGGSLTVATATVAPTATTAPTPTAIPSPLRPSGALYWR